jgi:hypothetical protein
MVDRRRHSLRLGGLKNSISFCRGVLLFLTPFLHATADPAAHSPNEVLLVYNSNSPTSKAIAGYYRAKRGVTHVLAINCEDSALSSPLGASNGFCGNNEIIPLAGYTSQIETPIRNYLASHSGINFIVLTKGIPIRIGGQDVGNITNGCWTEYNVNLNGATSFTARVASNNSGGNIQVCLDSPTGTVIGTCTVPGTGGWQTWTTVNCDLTDTTGTHNLYLVYTGASGALFNIEWFTLGDTNIPATSYNNSSGGVSVEKSNEGGAPTGSEQPPGQNPVNYTPSVDSCLAALGYSIDNGDVKAAISGSGSDGVAWVNKYYNSTAPFTHAQFGGYLVTRLDGYIQSDATALVDRSLAAMRNLQTGTILFDVPSDFGSGDKTAMPPVTPSTKVTSEEGYDKGNADLLHAADILEASGIPHDTVITNKFVGDQGNLLGYFSWGSNDDHYDSNKYESLSFAPGALSNTYVSNSMCTFIGQYVGFNGVDLTGMTSLNARVANPHPSSDNSHFIFQIHIDSPSGPVIGTCAVPKTGGSQTWTTATCPLTSVSGVHNVYLVFVANGNWNGLYNIEWISFQGGTDGEGATIIKVSSCDVLSGEGSLETCSEGGKDLCNIPDGQSLMCDLIANGLTGAEGNVSEPTLNGVVGIAFTVKNYEAGYNLAESFYAGTPYLGWEEIVVGDPLCAPYFTAKNNIVTPTQASNYDGSSGGLNIEGCSEGAKDVGSIGNGSYTSYNNIDLDGISNFVARVASQGSGGNIEIHLDSPTGTAIGTCAVPVTGDWQKWTTEICAITPTTGTHDIYLVYTGSGGYLFNIEWFAFRTKGFQQH